VLGGVCGGLADYSGVDALLWRVGFLAFALAGPGALVYLLLFLLMPLGPAPAGVRPSPLDRLADRLRGRTPDPRPAA
jgi:phage shock protein PspC (stress-responsive transcriptional regulator)